MAIVIVGGSTKDIGKTEFVCAIIAALREFAWTAVKITAHDYLAGAVDQDVADHVPGPAIREETSLSEQTDTSRYLASGARRALLVTRGGEKVPVDEIRHVVAADRNVIFESNRIVDAITPDVCLALVARPQAQWKPSFHRLLKKADAVVGFDSMEMDSAIARDGAARFVLNSGDRLPSELEMWLRGRLRATTI